MKLKYLGIVVLELLIIVILLKNLLYPCEILIQKIDDNEYKAGDIRDVKENGHNWGSGNINSELTGVIYCPDMPIAEAIAYKNDGKSFIDLTKIPVESVNTMKDCKKTTIISSEVKACIVQKAIADIEP